MRYCLQFLRCSYVIFFLTFLVAKYICGRSFGRGSRKKTGKERRNRFDLSPTQTKNSGNLLSLSDNHGVTTQNVSKNNLNSLTKINAPTSSKVDESTSTVFL